MIFYVFMYSAFLLAFQYFLMLPYFIFKCNSFLFFFTLFSVFKFGFYLFYILFFVKKLSCATAQFHKKETFFVYFLQKRLFFYLVSKMIFM